jgi:hypothetical protein
MAVTLPLSLLFLLLLFSLYMTVVQTVPSFGKRYCVDMGREATEEFQCYLNPIDARRLVDGEAKTQQISRGVNQRVEGTDEEKRAIQEVLSRMDDYYYDMVLALPVRFFFITRVCLLLPYTLLDFVILKMSLLCSILFITKGL